MVNYFENFAHDVEKLHFESLQLRNQQFQLAAISLAGSGVTAWIAPGLTAFVQGTIPEIALVGGSLYSGPQFSDNNLSCAQS